MRLDDFDYYLPEELIAQSPLEQRDGCRLKVLDRREKTVEHRRFYDILDYVNPGDCLVLNDSRVIPARMYGLKKGTGAHIDPPPGTFSLRFCLSLQFSLTSVPLA